MSEHSPLPSLKMGPPPCGCHTREGIDEMKKDVLRPLTDLLKENYKLQQTNADLVVANRSLVLVNDSLRKALEEIKCLSLHETHEPPLMCTVCIIDKALRRAGGGV